MSDADFKRRMLRIVAMLYRFRSDIARELAELLDDGEDERVRNVSRALVQIDDLCEQATRTVFVRQP